MDTFPQINDSRRFDSFMNWTNESNSTIQQRQKSALQCFQSQPGSLTLSQGLFLSMWPTFKAKRATQLVFLLQVTWSYLRNTTTSREKVQLYTRLFIFYFILVIFLMLRLLFRSIIMSSFRGEREYPYIDKFYDFLWWCVIDILESNIE